MRELVFAIEKISNQKFIFSEIIFVDTLHRFLILNCFVQLSCFIHTTEVNNNPLLNCKEVRLSLGQSKTNHLTSTSNPIQPPSKYPGFPFNQRQFYSKIHFSPTSFMLSYGNLDGYLDSKTFPLLP